MTLSRSELKTLIRRAGHMLARVIPPDDATPEQIALVEECLRVGWDQETSDEYRLVNVHPEPKQTQ